MKKAIREKLDQMQNKEKVNHMRGTHMPLAQKNKIRAGRYAFLYGPDWKEKLAARDKAREEARNNPNFRTPKVYASSGVFLSKREFLELLIRHLRDSDVGVTSFIRLAELYVEVKGWKSRNKGGKPGLEPGTKTHKELRVPVAHTGVNLKKVDFTEEEDVNDLIQRIEEQRKKG